MSAFALIFLGFRLAIYVIFVISPFVQAFYFFDDGLDRLAGDELRGADQLPDVAAGPGLHQGCHEQHRACRLALPPLVIILSLTLPPRLGDRRGRDQG